MATLTMRFDLRVPEALAAAPRPEYYRQALEMSAWAEGNGFLSVVLSEHHGVDDGYLPSPLTMAGAVLGRTNRILVNISALLIPLHDPLRIAEDVAVLDNIAPGRIGIIAGLGYRAEEFAMFGVDKKRRGRIMDDHLDVILQAWTGEPFEYRGTTVRVLPVPATKPHPLVLVGGSNEVAAKRAARLHLPFMPAIGDPELEALYQTACAEEGFTAGWVLMPKGGGFVHVTNDPDKAWAQLGAHLLHDANQYASWQTADQRSQVESHASTVDELRNDPVYQVLTPDECVAYAADNPLVFHPMCGGIPPELAWESLELFAAEVLPRL
jgi:alkanesulfonate monooxygenase SsuD/methylene tetrahydromethanopterin reductase-like flavin-dependent oxidoreductase (luciferase family)